jgi:hypothetical protein
LPPRAGRASKRSSAPRQIAIAVAITVAIAIAIAIAIALAVAIAIAIVVAGGQIVAWLSVGVAIATVELGAAEGHSGAARPFVEARCEQREWGDEGKGQERGGRGTISNSHARARVAARS